MRFSLARVYGIVSISPDEVASRLGEANFFVFDNTPDYSWKKYHVPGAYHLNAVGFGAHELPHDKDATLVFYSSGPLSDSSPFAATRARNLGYRHVFVMSDGIQGWMDADKPTETVL